MLPRERRLSRSQDINRVYRQGVYGSAEGLQVKALPNHFPTSRAVVIVSRKVSKKATRRNRIRRQLIGLLSDLWSGLASGYDVVVTVRDDLSELKPADQKSRLEQALRRCRLIN